MEHQLSLILYCAVLYHTSPATGYLNQIQPSSPDFSVVAVHQIEERLRISGRE